MALALNPFFVLDYVSLLFGMYIDLHVVCQGTTPHLTMNLNRLVLLPSLSPRSASYMIFALDYLTWIPFVAVHPFFIVGALEIWSSQTGSTCLMKQIGLC